MCEVTPKISWTITIAPRRLRAGVTRYASKAWPSTAFSCTVSNLALLMNLLRAWNGQVGPRPAILRERRPRYHPPGSGHPVPRLTTGLDDPLVDRAEQAPALRIEHLDPDPVAEGHERCARLAGFELLEHPPLGEAGGAARAVVVGHG